MFQIIVSESNAADVESTDVTNCSLPEFLTLLELECINLHYNVKMTQTTLYASIKADVKAGIFVFAAKNMAQSKVDIFVDSIPFHQFCMPAKFTLVSGIMCSGKSAFILDTYKDAKFYTFNHCEVSSRNGSSRNAVIINSLDEIADIDCIVVIDEFHFMEFSIK